MLVEVFDNHVYWETPCDTENKIKSERVPIRQLFLNKDEYLRVKYMIVADFLNRTLNPGNRFHNMVVMRETDTKDSITTTVGYNSTFKFSFGYEIIDGDKDTVRGEITIDGEDNIISYKRNSNVTTTYSAGCVNIPPRVEIVPCTKIPDPSSTGYPGNAINTQIISRNDSVVDTTTSGGNSVNFPYRSIGDGVENGSSLEEPAVSDKDSSVPENVQTVDSKDGISVLSNGAIEFATEDVNIDKNSHTMEAKKKASQEAFMATMNSKFKKSKINNSK